jgi:nickel-dependent lactate racemase
MLIGQGSPTMALGEDAVASLIAQAAEGLDLAGKRVLVIIPDGTRTAPIPLMFRLLYAQIGQRVAQLDYIIALGTHQPMSDDAIERHVGVSAAERAALYPNVSVFNHQWDNPDQLAHIGTIPAHEAALLSDGLLAGEVPVQINRAIFDYDQLIICGPVFPHEVVGFSGGAKYLFPGIAGAEVIDFSHWLGALATNMQIIGVKETPVRRIIHRAAEFVARPMLCLALVMRSSTLHGLYIGEHREAWSAAADLSAQLNVIAPARRFKRVLSLPALRYEDLWTAAKAMYKTEPAIEDGGEVIIYAPHIHHVSVTHGAVLHEIGYHVRDYFLKQWDKFKHFPTSVIAHSTHVRGQGSYDAATGVETARIQVTLATSIPEEVCRQINLGYADYRSIEPQIWADREDEGILLVPNAGEVLYRV